MQDTQKSVDEKLEIPQIESSRGRTIALVAGLLIVATAVAVYLLTPGTEPSPYRVTQVSRTSIVKEIRVTGHLELTDQVEVPAPIQGQLVKVFVQAGDSVEEGQLLAQLDKGSAQIAFHVAQAELEVAQARVSEAGAAAQRAAEALGRTERLANKGLASKSTLEIARSESAKARASVQAARAERSAAQKRALLRGRERERTVIVAPRAGLVLEVPSHTGMIVGPQTRLFRIGAPIEQMNIAAPIGEADIGEVAVGLEAEFEVSTYPGRIFDATVKHISPDSHAKYGAVFYDVRLATDNPERLLLPGMTAQVRIRVARVDDALAVREATLRFTPEGAPPAPARSRVWRVRGTELQEVKVEAGLSDGAITEVRPSDPESLRIDHEIVIGLALDGDSNVAAPSLSLRGQQ